MQVLLDANIYLNFFRKRDDQSIEYIESLLSLIKQKRFKLILPAQIKNEFINNKSLVVFDYIKEIQNAIQISVKYPEFIKKSNELKKLKNAVKIIHKYTENFIKEYKKRSFNPKSKINRRINDLFNKSNVIENEDNIMQRAYFRTLQGYPPRKGNKTFGDAIIWETLLENCTKDDLIIISCDKDFMADEKTVRINYFLESEWSNKSVGKTVKLYNNLGKFINDYSPKGKKPISEENIKKDLFELQNTTNLLNSWSSIYQSLDYNKKICSCCQKEFVSSIYSKNKFFGQEDKCPECCDLYLGEAKNCKKCGKHYHEAKLQFNSLFQHENICTECSDTEKILYLKPIE